MHLEAPEPVAEALRSHFSGQDPCTPGGDPWALDIRLVVFDVDGVWTDGSLDYGPDGERKRFNVRDGLAVKLLRKAGIEVALLSGRRSEAVERRAVELGVAHRLLGIDNKLPALKALLKQLQVEPPQVAYMGDDRIDLEAMAEVGLAVAPADAVPEVLAVADWTTAAKGGHGAVREFVERLLGVVDR